jgi:proteasome lid subunit RPN8/RPN11
MKLALPREFQTRIESEARAAYPNECCGLVEGVREGDAIRALALHPARNISTARDRFEIHPDDHFAALKTARANGHAIIGCYHSHPGGAPQPSETDLSGAGEENFLWLIAALAHPGAPILFGSFVYRVAAFEPVEPGDVDGADLARSSENCRVDRTA